MSEERKDLVTIVAEWINNHRQGTPKDEKALHERLEQVEEKPETFEEETPEEKPPMLPFAMRPKHTRR